MGALRPRHRPGTRRSPPRGLEPAAIAARGASGRSSRSRATTHVTGRRPSQPPNPAAPAKSGGTSGPLHTIERAECLLDQMPDFDQLDAELGAANDVARAPDGDRTELKSHVRALGQSLRGQISVLTTLLERLGRIAADLAEPR